MNPPQVVTTWVHEVRVDIVKHGEGVYEWVSQNGKYGSDTTFPSAAKAIDDVRKRF